jgi:heme exporter protein D
MNWASWSDFFAMGGYAFYVWGSYLVTLALLATEIVLLMLQKHRILAQISHADTFDRSKP